LKREASVLFLVAHHSAKKCLDSFSDEVSLFFQGKVPRIEQVKLSFWQITLICFCSLYGKERIVLSPQDQGASSREPVIAAGSTLQIARTKKAPITGSLDKTVRLWLLQMNDLVGLARTVVGRNFLADEWQLYFPGEQYRKTFPDLPGPD
jgi:hypothetical protein